jgi:HEAT repeat protein
MRRGPALVRIASAMSLARLRDLLALEWLLEHPEATARHGRRQLAALLRRFGPRGRPVLRAALRGWDTAPVHLAALDALGLWRNGRTLPLALELMERGAPEARAAAARALGAIRRPEATPALIAALDDDAWPVRAQAARALGHVGGAGAVEALAGRVGDQSWWVRRNAAYALAALGADGRDALRRLASQRGDPYAREMAREALQRLAWSRARRRDGRPRGRGGFGHVA